jgi:hypothetical protein
VPIHKLWLYLSHPIGDNGDRDGRFHDNISNVGEWFRFFIDNTQYVVLCPWYIYAVALQGGLHVPRRLIDSIAAIDRSDVVAQCGGYLSPHMVNYEGKAARKYGTPIADLTRYGVLPPDKDSDYAEAIIQTIEKAIVRQPRRVWMPLLPEEDINALKKLIHDIDIYLPKEHQSAISVLVRILEAAHEGIGG